METKAGQSFLLLKYAFLSGLFLLPFVFWPQAEIAYEIPKVWFFQRWVELLAIISLLNIPTLAKKEKDKKLLLAVFFFIMLAIISSFLGADLLKSFAGNYYRLDGLITLFHLSLLFVVAALFWTDEWRFSLTAVIAYSSLILSAYTVYLGFRYYLLLDYSAAPFGQAIGATFGQPNFLAGFLLITLPFLELKRKAVRQNFFWLGAEIFQMIAIILTLSKAGMIGIVFWLGLTLLIKNWSRINKKKLFLLLFILFCLGFGAYLRISPLQYSNLYPESRTRVFVHSLLAVAKRPILGWGWANFDYAFKAVAWPYEFRHDVYYDKAHSSILEVLTTTGILGLTCYLLIIVKIILKLLKAAVKSEDIFYQTLLTVFLLFLFHAQTNVLSINEELFFWLIGGIAAGSAAQNFL